MEPVLVALHVLLRRNVEERLVERDQRHFVERDLEHPFDVWLIGRIIDRQVESCFNKRLDLFIAIVHRVEEMAVLIDPEEVVIRVVQPATEVLHVHWQRLLNQRLGAPVGTRDLVEGGLDPNLAKSFLHQQGCGL